MKKYELKTYEQIKEKALRLLEFRAHSEGELFQKLRQQGASEEHIEQVLAFCREYGFVNDEDFAIRKARDLQNIKKFGKHRIMQELRAKGISGELANMAVSQLDFEENDLKPMIEKKLKGDFDKKNIDKCIRYFIYRGYDFGQIKNCIEELKGEIDDL